MQRRKKIIIATAIVLGITVYMYVMLSFLLHEEQSKEVAPSRRQVAIPPKKEEVTAVSAKPTVPEATKASKFIIPENNLQIPEKLQVCAANFRKIHAAIKKYEKDKGKLPGWLSDLVPDYLSDEMLFCPNDTRHNSPYSPDPRLPCSYGYEFSSARIPSGWDPTRRTRYRDWKTQQVKLFGGVVPIVRCHHHGSKRLNLSVGGQIYWGQLNWEYMFKRDYRFGDESSSQQRGAELDRLIDRLKDGDSKVRAEAASALGRMGDLRAVEPLIVALKDEDRYVRSSVAQALGSLGDKRAVEALTAAMKDDEDSRVRQWAAEALRKLGRQPGTDVDAEEKKMTIESAVKVMRGIEQNKLSQEEMDKKGKELDEAWKYLIAKGEKSAIYLKSELNKLRQKEEKDDHFALGAASILWEIRGVKEANTIAQIWETADQLVNYSYVFKPSLMAARERNPKVIPMLKATLREKRGTFFLSMHAMNLVWPLTQEWIWGTYGSLGLPELEKVLLKSNIPAELESAIYILSNAQYVKVLPRVRELINHKNDDVKVPETG